jgi:four helix bundle suffix protein
MRLMRCIGLISKRARGRGSEHSRLPDSPTNYVLDQQLRQLEQAFLKEGGLRERITKARISERSKAGR